MIVKSIAGICVLLFMCAVMVVLARQLRGISVGRLLVNLLFPFSQLCIVAFLLYYALAFNLPDWMFALVVVVGVLCGPIDLVLFRALRESEERELSRERVRLLEEQLRAQEEYLQRLSSDIGEACRIREEVASELASVDELLDRREAEQASRGLMKAVDLMDSARRSYCGHPVVDALVSMKAAACEEHAIRFEPQLALDEDVALSSVELCAVFSNLLDNAINACDRVPESERFVRLKARMDAGYLVVRMENSCVPTTSARRRASALRGGGVPEHGWGLSILGTLAERHGGRLEVAQESGVFTTTVVLRADEAAAPVS